MGKYQDIMEKLSEISCDVDRILLEFSISEYEDKDGFEKIPGVIEIKLHLDCVECKKPLYKKPLKPESEESPFEHLLEALKRVGWQKNSDGFWLCDDCRCKK